MLGPGRGLHSMDILPEFNGDFLTLNHQIILVSKLTGTPAEVEPVQFRGLKFALSKALSKPKIFKFWNCGAKAV